MDSKYTVLSRSPEDTYRLGESIALDIKNGDPKNRRAILLKGNLGSGKTVLVKGFLSGFGITSRVLSPTFTIEKTYEVEDWTIRHFDLYRVDNASEVIRLGMKEAISDKKTIVLIEWAEKMQDMLPKERIDIMIEVLEDVSRRIYIQSI